MSRVAFISSVHCTLLHSSPTQDLPPDLFASLLPKFKCSFSLLHVPVLKIRVFFPAPSSRPFSIHRVSSAAVIASGTHRLEVARSRIKKVGTELPISCAMLTLVAEMASLNGFPDELIVMVGDNIGAFHNPADRERTFAALSLTNRRFHLIFNDDLYKHDARNRSEAMSWGAFFGSVATMDRSRAAGASTPGTTLATLRSTMPPVASLTSTAQSLLARPESSPRELAPPRPEPEASPRPSAWSRPATSSMPALSPTW